jgi:uncharacterized protein (DUF1697 family)
MNTFIALIRGINVGGHNRLLMKDLRAVMEGLGFKNVKTYLQSGNVVFQSRSRNSAKLSHEISKAISDGCQLTLPIFVLSQEDLQAAIAAHPFPEGEGDPKSLHFSFLKSRPASPDLAKLDSLRAPSEKFELKGNLFYLYAPDGIGRSKLAANVEKALGVELTARNWRSVQALMSMALEVAE